MSVMGSATAFSFTSGAAVARSTQTDHGRLSWLSGRTASLIRFKYACVFFFSPAAATGSMVTMALRMAVLNAPERSAVVAGGKCASNESALAVANAASCFGAMSLLRVAPTSLASSPRQASSSPRRRVMVSSSARLPLSSTLSIARCNRMRLALSSITCCSADRPASKQKRCSNSPQILLTVPIRAWPIAVASVNSPCSSRKPRTRSRNSVAALRVNVVAMTPLGMACAATSSSRRIWVSV